MQLAVSFLCSEPVGEALGTNARAGAARAVTKLRVELNKRPRNKATSGEQTRKTRASCGNLTFIAALIGLRVLRSE